MAFATETRLGCPAVLLLESLPKPLPVSVIATPPYIQALEEAPLQGGTVDGVSDFALSLYYQTIHQKPLALGYIARMPRTLVVKDDRLIDLYRHGEFEHLYQSYGLQYVIVPAQTKTALQKMGKRWEIQYEDAEAAIYDMAL